MVAPSKSQDPQSDTPSQADTPMTDANEEAFTSVPVDSTDAQMTVSDVETPALSHPVPIRAHHSFCPNKIFGELFLRPSSYLRATRIIQSIQ